MNMHSILSEKSILLWKALAEIRSRSLSRSSTAYSIFFFDEPIYSIYSMSTLATTVALEDEKEQPYAW